MAEITLATLNTSAAPPTLRGHERAAVVIHLDARDVPAETRAPTEATEATEADPSRIADRVGAAIPATPAEPGEIAAGTLQSRRRPRSRERARPYAHLESGPGLPDPVVKMLCAGRIRTAVHAGSGTVLDLGRSHRVVSDRQFQALLLRDDGCAHPGCASRHGLEAHHVRHWIHGGRTDLANLLLLCRVCPSPRPPRRRIPHRHWWRPVPFPPQRRTRGDRPSRPVTAGRNRPTHRT